MEPFELEPVELVAFELEPVQLVPVELEPFELEPVQLVGVLGRLTAAQPPGTTR